MPDARQEEEPVLEVMVVLAARDKVSQATLRVHTMLELLVEVMVIPQKAEITFIQALVKAILLENLAKPLGHFMLVVAELASIITGDSYGTENFYFDVPT